MKNRPIHGLVRLPTVLDIEAMFRLMTGRSPSSDEIDEARKILLTAQYNPIKFSTGLHDEDEEE